mmetsp:Transcript_3206/g.6726  ORF Transcript_3206/g.6726 Transcript_3206/m.6726 type:complete len:338 (+) Transcript_3206:282-1295(+)
MSPATSLTMPVPTVRLHFPTPLRACMHTPPSSSPTTTTLGYRLTLRSGPKSTSNTPTPPTRAYPGLSIFHVSRTSRTLTELSLCRVAAPLLQQQTAPPSATILRLLIPPGTACSPSQTPSRVCNCTKGVPFLTTEKQIMPSLLTAMLPSFANTTFSLSVRSLTPSLWGPKERRSFPLVRLWMQHLRELTETMTRRLTEMARARRGSPECARELILHVGLRGRPESSGSRNFHTPNPPSTQPTTATSAALDEQKSTSMCVILPVQALSTTLDVRTFPLATSTSCNPRPPWPSPSLSTSTFEPCRKCRWLMAQTPLECMRRGTALKPEVSREATKLPTS